MRLGKMGVAAVRVFLRRPNSSLVKVHMTRWKLPVLVACLVAALAGCSRKSLLAPPKASFHIGIAAGSAPDVRRGVDRLVKEYGAADDGMIRFVSWPDDARRDARLSLVRGLADDPLCRAIVVIDGGPGTAETFRKIREQKPDILLLAGNSAESPLQIESSADLAVGPDFITGGYVAVREAKTLGARRFVLLSSPGDGDSEAAIRRRAVMKAACAEFGLEFLERVGPDTTRKGGLALAGQFVRDAAASIVEKSGRDTAFSCTDPRLLPELIGQLVRQGGGFFPGGVDASFRTEYPAAFGLDLSAEAGDDPSVLKKLEAAVQRQAGAGRFVVSAYTPGYAYTLGLGEFAKRVIEKKTDVDAAQDLIDAFNAVTPGTTWAGSYYTDAATGVRARNHVLLFQDGYVFGMGYLGATKQPVPQGYFVVKE